MFWLGFTIGLFCGGIIALVLTSCMFAAGKSDERYTKGE